MKTIYVGIDQSLTNTGVSIIDGEKSPSFYSIKSKSFGVERLSFVGNEIIRIISEFVSKAGSYELIICREGYSYGSKSSSVFNLGELGGVIDVKIYESLNFKFKYYVIPPNTWKLIILGSGAVKKDTQYLLTAYDKTGVKFEDDNIADSYMLALASKKFNSYSIPEMSPREKFGMMSAHVRKKYKITDKKVKLIEDKDLLAYIEETKKEYLVTEK